MSNITIFKNIEEFDIFKSENTITLLGCGTEGVCYENNDVAYKFIVRPGRIKAFKFRYQDVITTKDVDLPSFAFPEHLYVLNGVIKCYSSKLVKDNLFTD